MEGTLEHVEVFLMVSVVTSIMKDLDLLSINDPREHPNTPSIMKSPFTYDSAFQASPGAIPLFLSMPLERQLHTQRVVVPFLSTLEPMP